MVENRNIREPKQSRSIQMKEKILDTSFRLFCEKGYYKTTTNEIAKTAGISIGSLYSYFKDRETILFEILDRYHRKFNDLHYESMNNIDIMRKDKKEWLRGIIENLISIHEISREFNRELNVLRYSNPDVAAILDQQKEETQQIILDYFKLYKDDIKVDDLEAAALISLDFISALVDRIVFEKTSIERERILNTGIEALYKFLLK